MATETAADQTHWSDRIASIIAPLNQPPLDLRLLSTLSLSKVQV